MRATPISYFLFFAKFYVNPVEVQPEWKHFHKPKNLQLIYEYHIDCVFQMGSNLKTLSTGQKFNGVEESLGIEMDVKDDMTQVIKAKTKNALR